MLIAVKPYWLFQKIETMRHKINFIDTQIFSKLIKRQNMREDNVYRGQVMVNTPSTNYQFLKKETIENKYIIEKFRNRNQEN